MRRSFRRALMTRVFNLLYHQFAWSYDAVSAIVSLGRWQDWGETALPFLSAGPILELGHGPGHLQLSMYRHGLTPVGIDLSPQMGHLARRRLSRQGIPLRLIRGRGQALPFADASFNNVVAVFPSPYILSPETVSSIIYVLRPGGRLIIVPEAQFTGSDPLIRPIEWLFRITGQRNKSHSERDVNEHFWRQALNGHFSVSIHTVSRAASKVTVIVAERNEPA